MVFSFISRISFHFLAITLNFFTNLIWSSKGPNTFSKSIMSLCLSFLNILHDLGICSTFSIDNGSWHPLHLILLSTKYLKFVLTGNVKLPNENRSNCSSFVRPSLIKFFWTWKFFSLIFFNKDGHYESVKAVDIKLE